MNTRKWLIVGSAIAILAVIFVMKTMGGSEPKEAKVVSVNTSIRTFETATVKNSTIEKSVPITGRLLPKERFEVYAEVGGKILPAKTTFKEGHQFKKGQPLMRINSRTQQLELVSQRSRFANSLLNAMSDLKQDYPDNFQAWYNYLNAFDPNKTAPNLPAYKSAQERNFFTARGIPEQFYSIQSKEDFLSKFTVYAPFSGVVVASNVDQGTIVSPQTLIGTFIRTDVLELQVGINPSDISYLKKGKKVSFQSNDSSAPIIACLTRIVPALNPETQQSTAIFEINGNQYYPGMYLNGSVPVTSYENAFELNKKFITRNNEVFVIQDSIIGVQKVVIEAIDDNKAVLSGLEDGQVIIMEAVTSSIQGIKGISKNNAQ